MSAGRPSLAELRAVAQPPAVTGRYNAEHWAGQAYMRRVSLHLTRRLVPTAITPDQVTWGMIGCGWLAVLVLLVPWWWTTVAAFVLIQAQLLLDCSDGELARWRRSTGVRGVYLDRIGHYSTDPLLAVALGVHADGGLGSLGGWTTLGFAAGLLVVLVKSENDLIHVSRVLAGAPRVQDDAETARPRGSGLRAARGVVGRVPFNRLLHAIEMSAAVAVAGIGDAVAGGHPGTRVLTLVLVAAGLITVSGHLLVILVSRRLD